MIFTLANFDFAMQSELMEPKWAEENLQTIRTLMERSAVYRRALAPIMLFAGALGIASAATGLLCHLDSGRAFGILWLGTAVVTVISALLITRRQVLNDKEVFWSPPTRHVGQALLPPLIAGMILGGALILAFDDDDFVMFVPFLWAFFYGCALHAAGFFMPKGVRLFGWTYIGLASGILLFLMIVQPEISFSAHWLMGFFFGVLHLAYGAYLYLTEKKNPVA
jgi:hypothetical protein